MTGNQAEHDLASVPRAVCVGLCTLDVIELVDRVPGPNEKITALESAVAAGGPATNAAVVLAHLGADTRLVTALADDPLSDVIRADLATCRVQVVARPAPAFAPSVAAILVTRGTGERAVASPSTAASTMQDVDTDTPDLAGVGVVLVDGYHPGLAIATARAARKSGIPVMMDAGSLKAHTADVAREVDLVVASGDFRDPNGSDSPDDVFEFLGALGVRCVAMTRGAEPVLFRTADGDGAVPVPVVDNIVDTLGAGDFFHGALAYRLAVLGLDAARLPDDLAWACAVAARSLQSFGTRAWLAR